ncbi:hypothetical protein [Streptomyces sp. NPDC006012]|uniref:hypothetical protein n=1 Tax=Streptomyces sp. NPDC006012 TaxID=3364739 RepID=UPI0036CBD372
MASPGYGKRTVPGESGTASRVPADFSHLPAREAYIAAFIDGLSDGAAMDIKSLAKVVPLYGQQAVRSALNALSRAGHLHRARGLAATGESGTRWVFRTYWSGTARDDAWWAAFLDAGEAPDGSFSTPGNPVNPTAGHTTPSIDAPDVSQSVESPPVEPHATTAYHVLARLGSREPRLALSAADCEALADLAIPWLERGASALALTRALTGGLPDVVHSPRGFVARRLRDKLPPVPVLVPVPVLTTVSGSVSDNRLFMPECTDCGVPGRPAAFVGGLCRGCRCRTVTSVTSDAHAPAAAVVQATTPGAEMDRRTAMDVARDALAARPREGREPANSRPAGRLRS